MGGISFLNKLCYNRFNKGQTGKVNVQFQIPGTYRPPKKEKKLKNFFKLLKFDTFLCLNEKPYKESTDESSQADLYPSKRTSIIKKNGGPSNDNINGDFYSGMDSESSSSHVMETDALVSKEITYREPVNGKESKESIDIEWVDIMDNDKAFTRVY